MAKNEIEYTAQNGMVTISTANSNLDGTGTLGTVITATENGTRIDRIYIKSTGDTTKGMVRLFIYQGSGSARLFKEISIPANDQRGISAAFSKVINFPKGLFLPASWSIQVATQKAESFNVIALGASFNYPVSETNIELTGNNSSTTVSTANTNLDGTGTLSTLITASNSGDRIDKIIVKAISNTTNGMVRLFLYDGSNTKLFMEVSIPSSTKSSVVPAFTKIINFKQGFFLKSGWSIKASTEVAETFVIMADSQTWDYV